jgi:outer membrane protein OmpA-like peptidoglycan-associated protein
MTVLTQGGETVTVVLTPATQVNEPEGVFRKKHLSMTALVPGLSVEVKGTINDQHQLVADSVTFHGSDLKTAQDIQAGLAPTQQQVQQNQQQIQADQQKIQQQQQELQVEEQKTAANKAAIAAANKRFGELGDYNILGELTVLFGNDKVTIDPQYKPQLLKLAQQAMGIKYAPSHQRQITRGTRQAFRGNERSFRRYSGQPRWIEYQSGCSSVAQSEVAER